MTIPRYRTGDRASDQFQGKTQRELSKLTGDLADVPRVQVLARKVIVPASPDIVEIRVPAGITTWWVAEMEGGFPVAQFSWDGTRLILTANGGENTVTIVGF